MIFNKIISLRINSRYGVYSSDIRRPKPNYQYDKRARNLLYPYELSELDIGSFVTRYETLSFLKRSVCNDVTLYIESSSIPPNLLYVAKYIPLRRVYIFAEYSSESLMSYFPFATDLTIRSSILSNIGNPQVISLSIRDVTINTQCVHDINNMKNLAYLSITKSGYIQILKNGSSNVLNIPKIRALIIGSNEFDITNVPRDIEYLDTTGGLITSLPPKKFRPIVIMTRYDWYIHQVLSTLNHIDTSRLKIIGVSISVLINEDDVKTISKLLPNVRIINVDHYHVYPKIDYARID